MQQHFDQFERKVNVRLPFADRYLASEEDAKKIKKELDRAFINPILTIQIPTKVISRKANKIP